jgi:hypothetical protein
MDWHGDGDGDADADADALERRHQRRLRESCWSALDRRPVVVAASSTHGAVPVRPGAAVGGSVGRS